MAGGPGAAAAGLPFPKEKLKRLLNSALAKIRGSPAASAEPAGPAASAASAEPAEPAASAVPAASVVQPLNPKPAVKLVKILGEKYETYESKKNDIITQLNKIKSDKCISIQQLTSKTDAKINTELQALNPAEKKMIEFFRMLFDETIIQFETDDPSIDLIIDTLEVCIELFIKFYPRESKNPKCLDIIQHYIVAFILKFIESFMNIVIQKINDPALVANVIASNNSNIDGIRADLDNILVEIIEAICAESFPYLDSSSSFKLTITG